MSYAQDHRGINIELTAEEKAMFENIVAVEKTSLSEILRRAIDEFDQYEYQAEIVCTWVSKERYKELQKAASAANMNYKTYIRHLISDYLRLYATRRKAKMDRGA